MAPEHTHGDGHPHGGDGHPHGESGGHPHSAGGGPSSSRQYVDAPMVLTWETTQACDLECDHCRAEANPDRDPEELSTREAKELIDSVADFGEPAPIFVFSGGDPLKRPDLDELIEHAVDSGLRTGVTPAPTSLLDRDVIDEFADLGVSRVALSLDGATAERHDEFRGEEGSYEHIMRTAEQARDAGMSIQINTTVTANTVNDLPAIADTVEELDAAMWEVFFLVPVGRGEELEQLHPMETVPVMEWLYRRQRGAPFRVITVEAPHYRWIAQQVEEADTGASVEVGSTRAGKGFTFVSYRGDVFPSGFLAKKAGNVREDDLVSIYRDSALFQELRDDDAITGPCGECEYVNLCGGSRSRAFASTGDHMASDPLCPYPDYDLDVPYGHEGTNAD